MYKSQTIASLSTLDLTALRPRPAAPVAPSTAPVAPAVIPAAPSVVPVAPSAPPTEDKFELSNCSLEMVDEDTYHFSVQRDSESDDDTPPSPIVPEDDKYNFNFDNDFESDDDTLPSPINSEADDHAEEELRLQILAQLYAREAANRRANEIDKEIDADDAARLRANAEAIAIQNFHDRALKEKEAKEQRDRELHDYCVEQSKEFFGIPQQQPAKQPLSPSSAFAAAASGVTINTVSSTSLGVDNSDEEEEKYYNSTEFEYHTDAAELDKIDKDSSRALPVGYELVKEMEFLKKKTSFTIETQSAPQTPAPMPAAIVADPKSVPLTPHHQQLERQHFKKLHYYMTSGLLFADHDSHRELQAQRQCTSKSTSSQTTSAGSTLHSHFTFSPSHSQGQNRS